MKELGAEFEAHLRDLLAKGGFEEVPEEMLQEALATQVRWLRGGGGRKVGGGFGGRGKGGEEGGGFPGRGGERGEGRGCAWEGQVRIECCRRRWLHR